MLRSGPIEEQGAFLLIEQKRDQHPDAFCRSVGLSATGAPRPYVGNPEVIVRQDRSCRDPIIIRQR
jgi:hypothetical protein